MNSNWSHCPETPNLGHNQLFFVPCDLEIWWMTLKNNRHLFYTTLSFVHHLKAMSEFNLELQSENTQFRSKLAIFCPVRPWNVTNDLEKQKGTSSRQHQALCIISLPYVNLNWSYGPETVKWGHDLCDLDLWPWPFAWTSHLSMVISLENFRMVWWQEHCQKGVTDGRLSVWTNPQHDASLDG